MQKRKNRPAPAAQRPDTSRPQPQQKRTVAADGVYNNPIFIHAVSSQLGNTVHLQTKSGAIYEGIFTTFSPQFNVLLEMAHLVEKDNDNVNVETVVEKYIFKPSDIVSIVAKDVDPEFATRDTFEIDTAISSRYNGTRGMDHKPLERWDSTGDALDNMCLELDKNSNGWDADEMFQKNESMYGVQSTFDHSLTGYTMQIEKSDSHAFRKAELEAEKIAREIESQTQYDERADLENGDEEQQFAAVVRPHGQSPHTFGSSGNSSQNNSSSNLSSNKNAVVTNASQKYVPPAKRKQGQQMGKLITAQTPPAAGGATSAPATPAMNSQPPTPQPVVTPPPQLVQQQQQHQQQQQGPPPPASSSHGGHKERGHTSGKGYNAPQYAPPPNVHNSNVGPHPNAINNNNNNHNNNYNNNNQGPMPPQQQQQQQQQQLGESGQQQQQHQQQQQQQMQHQQGPPPNQSQMSSGQNANHNPQSNHSGHANNHKQNAPAMVHQQPPPRHRQYAPQSHMPPNMSMPPQYASEAPPTMGPPPQMVMKGQPPPPHTIVMLPPQGPGQLLVVQGIAPPPGPNQKMMNPLPQRPPRGRDETVQDLKNFQDNYVLAPNPNASPGLTGGHPPLQSQQQQQQQLPPPMMHPQSVYAPPPQPPIQAQPPSQIASQQSGEDMKSQGSAGGPSPQPPSSSLPPPANPIQQQQGPPPSPSPGVGPPRQAGGPSQSLDSNSGQGAAGSGEKTEAKKSVLNPQAKPFTPRTPSTPNPSRPHTPQSVGAPQMVQSGPPVQTMGAPNGGNAQPTYQQTYLLQTQKPQFPSNRMRFVPPSTVQALSGSPLTLPYPLYQHSHAQNFHGQQYSMIRMFSPDAPQQMQYLGPSPHSTTPSPGAQYHQQSPAGGGPSQPFPQAAGQQPHFPTLLLPQQMVGQFHQNGPQPQYPNQYILMPTHNPNQ